MSQRKIVFHAYLTKVELLTFTELFYESDRAMQSTLKIHTIVPHSADFSNVAYRGVYTPKEPKGHPKKANTFYTVMDEELTQGKDIFIILSTYDDLIYSSFNSGMLKKV